MSDLSPAELLLETGDDGLPVGAVLLRLGLVAADDVAPSVEADLLGEELGLGTVRALDQQGREDALIGEDHVAHQPVGALAGAEDVLEAALLRGPRWLRPRSCRGQRRCRPGRWRSGRRRRSIHGQEDRTSAVLPGHDLRADRPALGVDRPRTRISCIRSGRWSFEWPRSPRVSPPTPSKLSEVVSMKPDSPYGRHCAGANQRDLVCFPAACGILGGGSMEHPAGESDDGRPAGRFRPRLRLRVPRQPHHLRRRAARLPRPRRCARADRSGRWHPVGSAAAAGTPAICLAGLLRQSVFGRLAGYEDVNDADRLAP